MHKLSPAAQAVLDAFEDDRDGEYVEGVWVVNERTMLASALRAAADQLTPYNVAHMEGAAMARNKLLDIANELENCS